MAAEVVPLPPDGQLLIYQEGDLAVRVRVESQTVWLPQRLIADLFQVSVKTANEHLGNIYEEDELDPEATTEESSVTAADGKNNRTKLYNLDAILAVGYRVRSPCGLQQLFPATQEVEL